MTRIQELSKEIVSGTKNSGYLFTSHAIENFTNEERIIAAEVYEREREIVSLVDNIEELYADQNLTQEELLSDIASEIALFKMKNV